MKTKIKKWLKEVESAGCCTFIYTRGSGFSIVNNDESFSWLRDKIDSSSIEEVTEEDEKIAKSLIELAREHGFEDEFSVYKVPDNNGYNQENFDIFFLFYEL